MVIVFIVIILEGYWLVYIVVIILDELIWWSCYDHFMAILWAFLWLNNQLPCLWLVDVVSIHRCGSSRSRKNADVCGKFDRSPFADAGYYLDHVVVEGHSKWKSHMRVSWWARIWMANAQSISTRHKGVTKMSDFSTVSSSYVSPNVSIVTVVFSISPGAFTTGIGMSFGEWLRLLLGERILLEDEAHFLQVPSQTQTQWIPTKMRTQWSGLRYWSYPISWLWADI